MTRKEFLQAIGGAERLAQAACHEDNVGFCVACGAEAFGVEPDARKYECEVCGEHRVYGAWKLLIECAA